MEDIDDLRKLLAACDQVLDHHHEHGTSSGAAARQIMEKRGEVEERLRRAEGSVGRRYEIQAKNEGRLREVNDQMHALDAGAGWADARHRFGFQCECGNPDGCDGRVEMTLEEYEGVRAQRDRFALVPGHQNDAIEDVVEEHERFVIVDKRDAVEKFVE